MRALLWLCFVFVAIPARADDFDPENPPPKEGCCDCLDDLQDRISDLSDLFSFNPDFQAMEPTDLNNDLDSSLTIAVPDSLNWFTDGSLEFSIDLNKTIFSEADTDDDDFSSAVGSAASVFRLRIVPLVELFITVYGVIACYSHLLLLKG